MSDEPKPKKPEIKPAPLSDQIDQLMDNHDKQYEKFLKITVLSFELKKLNESDRAFDLFNAAAKAYSTHAMMTALAFLIMDEELNWTPRQMRQITDYLEAYLRSFTTFNTRAHDMANVFIDELPESIYEKLLKRKKPPQSESPQ